MNDYGAKANYGGPVMDLQPIGSALTAAWGLMANCEGKADQLFDRIKGSNPSVKSADAAPPYSIHDLANQLAQRLDRLASNLQNTIDHI